MPDDPKPILFIDIDGVINAFLSHEAMDQIDKAEREDDLPHVRLDFSNRHWIYMPKIIPGMVAELTEHFELRWGTAWGAETANELVLTHLGLTEPLEGIKWDTIEGVVEIKFSGIHFEGMPPDFWKMPWIEHWALENDRPFIYIDDEIGDEAMAWAEERTEIGVPTLMIKTDDSVGWTQQHTDDMIQWAEEVRGS